MRYYPILLARAGETGALMRLTQAVKRDITPVLEVESPIKESLSSFLQTHWSFLGNRVILDFTYYKEQFGETHIEQLSSWLESLRHAGVNIALSLHSNPADAFQRFITRMVKVQKYHMCLRVSRVGSVKDFGSRIAFLIEHLGISPADTVMLFDAGYITETTFKPIKERLAKIVNELPVTVDDWRNVVVASSSFPVDLSAFNANEIHKIARFEWQLWTELLENSLLSGITYSDYGVKNPVPPIQKEGVTLTPSASVRYSLEKEYVIHRGTKEEKKALPQYVQHARNICSSGYYAGKNFSWGDLRIDEIAKQVPNGLKPFKPGNSTTWVQIGQNHHISLIHSLL